MYDICPDTLLVIAIQVYVAFVNWGGLRRLCAIQNYWAGSDDWVNTGDMMEQQIVARELPGLKAQLRRPLGKSGGGRGDTWLAKACKALGEGGASAAEQRVRKLIDVAERYEARTATLVPSIPSPRSIDLESLSDGRL
jgi:hypothetical protein